VSLWADAASDRIDALVAEELKKAGQTPNPPASDEIFLRRIYLDVIGRIPSQSEASEFLASTAPDKRTKLVDQLLKSEGYVSHWFNYWADVLRVKSHPNPDDPNDVTGDAYGDWVKDQLRQNVPYDKFVHGMLTASGYIWNNGAVGYYLRDTGMPLDNMANTVQVFLGSRVACAQCHDHPFDEYSQKDFYEMAAYTAGVDTRVTPENIIAEATGKKRMSRAEAKKLVDGTVREELVTMLKPLTYGTRQDPTREQKLPMDFRGDPSSKTKEAKPGDTVRPQPVFGGHGDIKANKEILANYADWVTSPDNPTFTVIIANRLWKQSLGLGLIEPVDDIKKDELDRVAGDATKLASNPALMAFLTQHIKQSGYDVKKVLRSIYLSKTYQSEATTNDLPSPDQYKFPGPVLKRLSAEQLWDSIVTLVIPEPDLRKGRSSYAVRFADMKSRAERLKDKLQAGKGKSLLELATGKSKIAKDYEEKRVIIRKKLEAARAASNTADANKYESEMAVLEAQEFDEGKALERAIDARSKSSESSLFAARPAAMTETRPVSISRAEGNVDDGKWASFGPQWIRASELPSPAPEGHFLQEFGQSERNIIEASSTDSSVTQALMLLNGPLFEQITSDHTQLGSVFKSSASAETKIDQIFLSVLSRRPTAAERQLALKQSQAKGEANMVEQITWALLNTREFSFRQ
jgi:hypothetical protein